MSYYDRLFKFDLLTPEEKEQRQQFEDLAGRRFSNYTTIPDFPRPTPSFPLRVYAAVHQATELLNYKDYKKRAHLTKHNVGGDGTNNNINTAGGSTNTLIEQDSLERLNQSSTSDDQIRMMMNNSTSGSGSNLLSMRRKSSIAKRRWSMIAKSQRKNSNNSSTNIHPLDAEQQQHQQQHPFRYNNNNDDEDHRNNNSTDDDTNNNNSLSSTGSFRKRKQRQNSFHNRHSTVVASSSSFSGSPTNDNDANNSKKDGAGVEAAENDEEYQHQLNLRLRQQRRRSSTGYQHHNNNNASGSPLRTGDLPTGGVFASTGFGGNTGSSRNNDSINNNNRRSSINNNHLFDPHFHPHNNNNNHNHHHNHIEMFSSDEDGDDENGEEKNDKVNINEENKKRHRRSLSKNDNNSNNNNHHHHDYTNVDEEDDDEDDEELSSASEDDDVEMRAQIDAEELLEQRFLKNLELLTKALHRKQQLEFIARNNNNNNVNSDDNMMEKDWQDKLDLPPGLTSLKKTFWEKALTEPRNALCLRYSSLFVFPPHMATRVVTINLIKTKLFEGIVLFFILLNCVLLAVENENLFGDRSAELYEIFDNVFVAVFSLEMVLKILAFGFVSHRGSYLRDPWNGLDFLIMILTYINFASGSGNFTALRSLRVLRPLRSLNAIPGLKILVRSFLASLRAMGPVALLSLMVIYVFAIVGVQLFSGAFHFSCVDDATREIAYNLPCRNGTTGDFDVPGGYWGFGCPTNYTCQFVENPFYGFYSFDNIFESLLVVFSFSTFDGWTIALERGMASVGVITFFFFAVCVLCVGILIPNLLLAVINLEYSREQERDRLNRENYSKRVRQLLSQKLNALAVRIDSTNTAANHHQGSNNNSSSSSSNNKNETTYNQRRINHNLLLAAATAGAESSATRKLLSATSSPTKSSASSPTKSNKNNNNNNNLKKDDTRTKNNSTKQDESNNNNTSLITIIQDENNNDGNVNKNNHNPLTYNNNNNHNAHHRHNEDDAVLEEDLEDSTNHPSNNNINNNNNETDLENSSTELQRAPSVTSGVSSVNAASKLFMKDVEHQQEVAATTASQDNSSINNNKRNSSASDDDQDSTAMNLSQEDKTDTAGLFYGHMVDNHHHHKSVSQANSPTKSGGSGKKKQPLSLAQSWDAFKQSISRTLKKTFSLSQETGHQIDVWRDACHELTEGFPRSSDQAAAIHVSRSNTSIARSFSHSSNSDFYENEDDEALRKAMNIKDDENNNDGKNNNNRRNNNNNHDSASSAASQGNDDELDDVDDGNRSGESSAQVDTGQIRSTWFTNLIVVMIVLNTALLASQHADQPDWLTDVQRIGNAIFTAIFAIEMIMRLFSIGVKAYVRSAFDLLDGFIVVSSLIELIVTSGSGTSTFSVFRALRLLRVMKLLKQFPSLRSVVRVALYAMGDASYLLFIVLLYIFVFSLLGQNLFNGKLRPGNPDEGATQTRFDSFLHSFYASFQILSMDLWVPVMYDIMNETHPLAAVFFIIQIITGGFILISLFLSILVAAFRKLESRVNQSLASKVEFSSDEAEKLREQHNQFKHNMLDATLVQRVYRFGAGQGRGNEFNKKDFTSASVGISGLLKHNQQQEKAVSNHLSGAVAKEYQRAKHFKEEEKQKLAVELKRRESVSNILFHLKNASYATKKQMRNQRKQAAADKKKKRKQLQQLRRLTFIGRDRADSNANNVDLLFNSSVNDASMLLNEVQQNAPGLLNSSAVDAAFFDSDDDMKDYYDSDDDDENEFDDVLDEDFDDYDDENDDDGGDHVDDVAKFNPFVDDKDIVHLDNLRVREEEYDAFEQLASNQNNNNNNNLNANTKNNNINSRKLSVHQKVNTTGNSHNNSLSKTPDVNKSPLLQLPPNHAGGGAFAVAATTNINNNSFATQNSGNRSPKPPSSRSSSTSRLSLAVLDARKEDKKQAINRERRVSLSQDNLAQHIATTEEIAEQERIDHGQLSSDEQKKFQLVQWVNKSSEALYRIKVRPTHIEQLARDHHVPRFLFRHQFKDYSKARRANSANKFYATAPNRSVIEDISRRVPKILWDHGPDKEDKPPIPRLPICSLCGEELHQALPPAPLVAQPSPEILHSLKCGKIRVRRARMRLMKELYELIDFYISTNEKPTFRRIDDLLAQAEEVHSLMAVKAYHFDHLEGNDSWKALREEVRQEMEILELRVGEDELGKSLIAQAFACIPVQHQTNGGDSLFVFDGQNRIRRVLSEISEHPYFEAFILICVVISSALLALSNPLDDPESTKAQVSFYGSFVFTIIFALESVIKIIALGFYFVPGAYLKDPWNVLDFIIAMTSLVSDTQSDVDLSYLKVFRTLRATRTLRVLRRAKGMKTVVFALVQNIKAIANVGLLCLIFLLIFAILAVQLYAGEFRSCSDPSVNFASNCTGFWYDENAENVFIGQQERIPVFDTNTSTVVLRQAGSIVNSRFGAWVPRVFSSDFQNFDSVPQALLTLFEITSAEGWIGVVWRATDTCDINTNRRLTSHCNPASGLFFVAFFAFSSFFLMQLFVSFIIYNYEKVNKTVSGSEFLTAEQRVWISTQQLVSNFKPSIVVYPREGSHAAKQVYDYVVNHIWFDIVIALCIISDVIVLSMEYYGQSAEYASGLETASVVVAFIFLVEAMFKLFCYGLRYFRSSENRFDFFLVLIGIFSWSIFSTNLRFLVVLRVIRLSRILRLLRFAKGIQILLETLVFSLPSIANMGAFIILITFSFGVLGVDTYATLYIPPNAHVLNERRTNFRQLDSALMLLFRFLTLEDWVGVMRDASIRDPTCVPENNSCGSALSPLYFCLYVVATSYIVLNLIMASMLVQFELTMALDESNPKMAILHRFVEQWSSYDRDATLLIPTMDIPRLLVKLGPPMGLLRAGSRVQILKKMGTFFIPDHCGKVHFMEVLLALEMGLSPPKEDDADRIKREFFVMMKDNFPELEELPVQRIGNGRMITADLQFAQTYLAASVLRRKAYRLAQNKMRALAAAGLKHHSLLMEDEEYFIISDAREADMERRRKQSIMMKKLKNNNNENNADGTTTAEVEMEEHHHHEDKNGEDDDNIHPFGINNNNTNDDLVINHIDDKDHENEEDLMRDEHNNNNNTNASFFGRKRRGSTVFGNAQIGSFINKKKESFINNNTPPSASAAISMENSSGAEMRPIRSRENSIVSFHGEDSNTSSKEGNALLINNNDYRQQGGGSSNAATPHTFGFESLGARVSSRLGSRPGSRAAVSQQATRIMTASRTTRTNNINIDHNNDEKSPSTNSNQNMISNDNSNNIRPPTGSVVSFGEAITEADSPKIPQEQDEFPTRSATQVFEEEEEHKDKNNNTRCSNNNNTIIRNKEENEKKAIVPPPPATPSSKGVTFSVVDTSLSPSKGGTNKQQQHHITLKTAANAVRAAYRFRSSNGTGNEVVVRPSTRSTEASSVLMNQSFNSTISTIVGDILESKKFLGGSSNQSNTSDDATTTTTIADETQQQQQEAPLEQAQASHAPVPPLAHEAIFEQQQQLQQQQATYQNPPQSRAEAVRRKIDESTPAAVLSPMSMTSSSPNNFRQSAMASSSLFGNGNHKIITSPTGSSSSPKKSYHHYNHEDDDDRPETGALFIRPSTKQRRTNNNTTNIASVSTPIKKVSASSSLQNTPVKLEKNEKDDDDDNENDDQQQTSAPSSPMASSLSVIMMKARRMKVKFKSGGIKDN